MSWRDRDYNQLNFGGRQIGNPILNFLFGSISIGTWFGAHVRIHSSFILYALFLLLTSLGRGTADFQMQLTNIVTLFGIILLHEYGHCIAARKMGGRGDEIIMWMFGGLAMADSPHRPWARFVTIIGGPLVNVLICVVTGGTLLLASHFTFPLSLNPLRPFDLDPFKGYAGYEFMAAHRWAFYVWWVFANSYSNLLFNLLPIFPLDGGQMVQAILWHKFGYYKSMMISCMVGMIGAAVVGLFALRSLNILLLVLCFIGFLTCMRLRQATAAQGPEDLDGGVDYSAAYDNPNPRRKKMRKSWFKAARRRAQREQSEQARIDAILAKVHEKGLQSLTWFEKRALKRATERQREQERDYAGRL